MGSCIDPAEFLEAGCTAKPGLTKAAPAHEEEGARARADTTAQRSTNGGLHLAPRGPHLEQWQCLAEDTGSCDGDNRLLQLCVVGNPMDGPTNHCREIRWPVADMSGRVSPGLLPPVAGTLTKVAGAGSQEELSVTTGPAGT